MESYKLCGLAILRIYEYIDRLRNKNKQTNVKEKYKKHLRGRQVNK